MKSFKVNNKVHEIEEGFEYLLPVGAIQITDEEAVILLTPAPLTEQEIDYAKTSQVESEIGTDVVRVIIETIVPMIQDGSITSKTPNEVIAQAKANRLAEL
ncbi:hypothetical protein KA005_44480 [bacterium]|nr:hypothetical protein [bacterium]